MYGEKFHTLRQSKDVSLIEAAKNITSKSSLARWEHGQGTMDSDKVAKLIKRLGINPSEFFTFEYDPLTNQINKACFNSDVPELLKLTHLALNKLHENPSVFINLFNAAIASNFYYLFTKKLLLPQSDLNRLLDVLFDTSFWSQEKIDLFGGSVFLIPSDKVISLSKRILKQIDRIYKISDAQFFNTMSMLLNAILALIEQKRLTKAKQLYSMIDDVYLSEGFTSLFLRKYFYHLIINFVDGKDNGEMQALFKILDYLGLKHTLSDYKFDFEQVKTIYKIS